MRENDSSPIARTSLSSFFPRNILSSRPEMMDFFRLPCVARSEPSLKYMKKEGVYIIIRRRAAWNRTPCEFVVVVERIYFGRYGERRGSLAPPTLLTVNIFVFFFLVWPEPARQRE